MPSARALESERTNYCYYCCYCYYCYYCYYYYCYYCYYCYCYYSARPFSCQGCCLECSSASDINLLEEGLCPSCWKRFLSLGCKQSGCQAVRVLSVNGMSKVISRSATQGLRNYTRSSPQPIE